MDEHEMQELSKEFSKDSQKFLREFMSLYNKWFKKNPRLTLLMTVSMPLSMLASMAKETEMLSKVFPELPDVMRRYLMPFYPLREEWGKIPDSEFFDKYQQLYEEQFDEWLISDDDKEQFKKFYKGIRK